MAVQYQISKSRPQRQKFLTPMGAYHGGTQGAMSVCDPVTGMHTLFNRLLSDHLFMEHPSCRFDKPFEPSSLDDARRFLKAHGDEIAAAILEPVVQGVGGMWFYQLAQCTSFIAFRQKHCHIQKSAKVKDFKHIGLSRDINVLTILFCRLSKGIQPFSNIS